MSLLETPYKKKFFFKKKICILGGVEAYKDEFQKRISSNSLPLENKQNIGVNISKIDFLFKNYEKFEFLLWNIDCRQPRAYLRPIFYNGAEAILIFVSERKVEQILQYFNEIHERISSIALIFCIILEKYNKKDIIDKYFKKQDFTSIIKLYNIKIHEISKSSDILNQICSISLEKIDSKEIEDVYIIDFIPLDLLFDHSNISDECNDYFEPEYHEFKNKQPIDTEKLIKFILKLKLKVQFETSNWIKIKNKTFGTFSIYLKNGNVYYFPKICEKCKDFKCSKLKKAPFFICTEAEQNSGWTNIKDLKQPELIVLSKIYLLTEGTEKNLPRSIIKQIKSIDICKN
ncbi:MAG: hypothetical protein ACFE9Z_08805 [Promethearchaeota archaeon]